MGNFRESKITFLWMIPITKKERDIAISEGSEKLISKLNILGTEVFSLNRPEVY
ncbi:suppressor of fused domain protein [Flammeovirga agarivorans]|uniref:Suppressor of fused domain protein n=1 Tax=Flammeovirga agarivorans TaxID=2726742 RepID=A0A7X8SRU7_9BACT|nr:suppressor of fused domain protein [Flammeovirga agarivorans]